MRVWFHDPVSKHSCTFLSSLDRNTCYLTRSEDGIWGFCFTEQVKQCLSDEVQRWHLEMFKCVGFPRRAPCRTSGHIHGWASPWGVLLWPLGPRDWLPLLFQLASWRMSGLCFGLPGGTRQVNTPLTGCCDETQALATWSFHPKHHFRWLTEDVIWFYFSFNFFVLGYA